MTRFIIGIAVAVLVLALILPIGLNNFFAVDTGSWDAQTVLMWGIIPVIAMLVVVLFLLNRADANAGAFGTPILIAGAILAALWTGKATPEVTIAVVAAVLAALSVITAVLRKQLPARSSVSA